MDSPVFNTIKNVAGYGVGTLAALDTIKSGGLGSYLMNRQRLMSDPGFRSTLAGSPFMAGVFGVSGGTGPAPAAPGLPAAAGGGAVAQPTELVGPTTTGQPLVAPPAPAAPGGIPGPTALNAPGYMPGTPRQWMPNLPPYDPKTGLEQLGLATARIGLEDPDAGRRAQAKMAAQIPLTDDEIVAATKRGAAVQALGGPGTVVKLDIPGMTTNVGSPYNLSAVTADEYSSYALATAAAASRNASIPAGNPQWTVRPSGRGSFLLDPPATAAQTAPPAQAPAVAPAARTAPPAQAPAPVQQAAPVQQPAPAAAPPVRRAAPAARPAPAAPAPAPAKPAAPPPAAAPAPAPAPAPPAPPPASSFDLDATVPHVVVPEPRVGYPSPAPAEERVGYAPPAPGAPPPAELVVPVVPKPPVVQPPMPAAEPMPPPWPTGPVVPKGPTSYPPGQQMPMTSETRKTAEGEQTFHAPTTSDADVRLNLNWAGITNPDEATPEKIVRYRDTQRQLERQRELDKAEIARTQKAVLEGDGAGLASLVTARENVNRLLIDFPDPNVRAYYVGTLRYPLDALTNLVKDDPMVARFHNDVAALGIPVEGSSMIGRMLGLPSANALLPGEQGALRSVLPSGTSGPHQFEENLQLYRDTIDSAISVRDFLRGRPAGAVTVADINQHLAGFNDALMARRLAAFNVQQAPAAPPPAAAPPPPAAAPPGALPWAPTSTWTVQ